MTTAITKSPVRDLFARPDVTNKFREIIGKRSTQFVTSVLQIVAQTKKYGTNKRFIYARKKRVAIIG